MNRLALMFAVLVTVCGCNSAEDVKNVSSPPIVELTDIFGSPEAVGTVRNATHVKVYRLPGVDNLFDGDTIKSVIDTSTTDELSPTLAKSVRDILLDSATYRKSAKLCWPDYAMRIQFSDGQKTVDVLFCFDCSMLKVYQNGRAFAGVQDFDPAHPKLARLAKEAFPNDAVIQSISMDACGSRPSKPDATMPDAPANPAR